MTTPTDSPQPANETAALVNALRDALAKTTPGEWISEIRNVNVGDYDEPATVLDFAGKDWMTFWEAPTDAAFIALAHNSLPALLSRLQQAERENADWRAWAKHVIAVASRLPPDTSDNRQVELWELGLEARKKLAELAEGGKAK